MIFLRALLPAILLLSACAHAPPSSTRLLDEAAQAATRPDAAARTVALAGFRALLVDGNTEEAARLFTAALRKDPGDPWALTGTMALARRNAHPERALEAALELCTRAPRHPLCAIAARVVSDMAGTASSLDERILERVPRALEAGAAGDAAGLLRGAVAAIAGLRTPAARAESRAALGIPDRATLVGPLSPLHALGFSNRTAPERDGVVPGTLPGPFGATAPRDLEVADGRVSLASEGPQGDVYVLAMDVEAAVEAVHVVRTVSAGSLRAVLDGTVLFERRSFARSEPSVNERAVTLAPGRHRLVLVLLKEERSGAVGIALPRADGRPASLRFFPASGAPPRWDGAREATSEGLFPDVASLKVVLLEEGGEALATWIAVRDGMGRDREGAKRALQALGTTPATPAWSMLRADLSLGDRTVPSKVARGRATRDLEAALERDRKDVSALLSRAALALDDQRTDQASEFVKQARAAHAPVGYPVLALDARLALALNLEAQADDAARAALASVDGLCEALALRYDLALRRDAVAEADRLLGTLATCPSEQGRAVEHAKARGRLSEAVAAEEKLLARDPTNVNLGLALVNLLVAARQEPKAVLVLEGLRAAWPRDATLPRRLGEVAILAGRPKQALAAREDALRLDGSDLALRRTVERARTGKEILSEWAVDAKTAIRAYEAKHRNEEAPGVLVLDGAAVRAYPDGSMVDRIHIIQKVLDQSGVAEAAEVQIPAGAAVLALRTIKSDGTVLEPESFEGKETVSLPGVAVGDYVEYEYLQAHPARGPVSPGWTAAAFYFRVARLPDTWAHYTVVAPKGTGMKAEGHQMRAPAVETRQDEEVFHIEVHDSPAYIPEPDSPPSPNETLPFVVVGAGDEGQDGLLRALSDAFLEKGLLTAEVEQFAREAAAGKQGRAAVDAVYAAVMNRVQGRDAGLSQSASGTLAQDRGSRLWLLKASLEAVGIPARVAAVRTFAVNRGTYLFPNEQLLPYSCVRAEPGDGEPIWLDPAVRFSPVGVLPEQATDQEAWLLPEPGRPLARLKTPSASKPPGKEITLSVALAKDGKLTGQGTETYRGTEAAALGEALEQLPLDQRNQALQQAFARYFGGAELSSLKVEATRSVGAPLTIHYVFSAPRFARVEDRRIVMGPLTFPTFLGRRYVQVGQRQTPLFIDSTEQAKTHVTLQLPEGYRVDQPLPDGKVTGPFGGFTRSEAQDGRVFKVEETYRLDMGRIPVKQYDDFAQFAGEVDLLQSRDVVLEPNNRTATR